MVASSHCSPALRNAFLLIAAGFFVYIFDAGAEALAALLADPVAAGRIISITVDSITTDDDDGGVSVLNDSRRTGGRRTTPSSVTDSSFRPGSSAAQVVSALDGDTVCVGDPCTGVVIARGLAAPGAHSKLQTLSLLMNNCIGGSATNNATATELGRALAAQGAAGAMRSLCLGRRPLGWAAFQALTDGVRASALESLELLYPSDDVAVRRTQHAAVSMSENGGNGGGSGDVPLPPVPELRGCRLASLTILGLSDAGVARLLLPGGFLRGNRSLTFVDLQRNNLSDATVLSLALWAAEDRLGVPLVESSCASQPLRQHKQQGRQWAAASAGAAARRWSSTLRLTLNLRDNGGGEAVEGGSGGAGRLGPPSQRRGRLGRAATAEVEQIAAAVNGALGGVKKRLTILVTQEERQEEEDGWIDAAARGGFFDLTTLL